MRTLNYFIKVIRVGETSKFHIQQGKSDTDIAQQPEDGYPTEEAARVAKIRLIKSGQMITLRKKTRKR